MASTPSQTAWALLGRWAEELTGTGFPDVFLFGIDGKPGHHRLPTTGKECDRGIIYVEF